MNRAAYLQGLADGMKLDTETNEGKLLNEIIDLIADVADELDMLDDEQGDILDKIDEMEDVIEIIGDEVFDGGEYDDDDDNFDDNEMYTIVCEKCAEEIEISGDDLEDIASGAFHCPNCGEIVEIDFSGCDCGCECGDGCDCE
ncbi:MAG: hypothetical protein RSC29_04910 [Oscillospiraceae bacterium]